MANILGVNTGEKGKAETLSVIGAFYNDGASHYLVTPNPEIILQADVDEELFYILNNADLSLADGFGLKIAAVLSHQPLHRQTGADLLPFLLADAETNRRRLVIINWLDGLSSADDIRLTLEKKYPNLNSLIIDSSKISEPTPDQIKTISEFQPDLAICLLGSPYQEKYIYHLRAGLKRLPLAAGLGGAFDFLTGKIKRAPSIWRQLGLEWFWRLLQQPSRWRRIYRATFVFGFKVLHWLVVLPRLYRPNVAVLMYKHTDNGREIFIVERQGENSHWQMPQGGLDGLSIEEGGAKELREESGAVNFKIIAAFRNLYRYKFDKGTGRYSNPNSQRHFGYRGQRQSLLITEFTGTDEEIKINYWDHRAWRWVPEDELILSLHAYRQPAAAIYLQKLKSLKP